MGTRSEHLGGKPAVQDLKPGSEFAGYRIESVERHDDGAAVLRAEDRERGRGIVALHVAAEAPGSVNAVRFTERAHRLETVQHPHLLPVFDVCTLEGRAVAVTQAAPGRRLDRLLGDGPLGIAPATRIARQVASAVEALEGVGAELPPLNTERIWVNGAGGTGHAYLDALDGRSVVGREDRPPSSSAAVGDLLEALVGAAGPDDSVPGPLREVVTRALDGAYLSVTQLTDALRRIEAGAARAARRRRRTALTVAVVATLVTAAIVVAALVH
jgi:hypothetical protein